MGLPVLFARDWVAQISACLCPLAQPSEARSVAAPPATAEHCQERIFWARFWKRYGASELAGIVGSRTWPFDDFKGSVLGAALNARTEMRAPVGHLAENSR